MRTVCLDCGPLKRPTAATIDEIARLQLAAGEIDQLLRFVRRDGERLIDHDVLAGEERAAVHGGSIS